jgi:Double-stranded RNA binding motif
MYLHAWVATDTLIGTLNMQEPEAQRPRTSSVDPTAKSRLQQVAHTKFKATPQYQLLEEKGPDHKKCFKICAVIGRHHYSGAWGRTKKAAEQKAAMNALAKIAGEQIPFPEKKKTTPGPNKRAELRAAEKARPQAAAKARLQAAAKALRAEAKKTEQELLHPSLEVAGLVRPEKEGESLVVEKKAAQIHGARRDEGDERVAREFPDVFKDYYRSLSIDDIQSLVSAGACNRPLAEGVICEKICVLLEGMSVSVLEYHKWNKSKEWPTNLVDAELTRRRKQLETTPTAEPGKERTRTKISSWDDAVGPDSWRLHGA